MPDPQRIGLLQVIGAILLIIGTSIGGAVLALPLATAKGGFLYTTLFLFFSWFMMTAGAFYVLEVTLSMPEGSNMISMAENTLGKEGAIVTWCIYLILLYSLLSAYMSASSDVTSFLLNHIHIDISRKLCIFLVTLVVSIIVYNGVHTVDVVNRFIMSTKLVAFIAIIVALLPVVHIHKMQSGHPFALLSVMTVIITSFGYSIIVPSLRSYFHGNIEKLKQVIMIGSLIPLICYILWVLCIFGTLHKSGDGGLLAIAQSDHSSSLLMQALTRLKIAEWFGPATKTFTTLSVFTSFLGVSLCLFDFFVDGLHVTKHGVKGQMVNALTFVPPLLIVLFWPGIFIYGLSIAGITATILLMLLPAIMAWRARYNHPELNMPYQLFGGKPLLIIVIFAALGIISLGLWHDVIVPMVSR